MAESKQVFTLTWENRQQFKMVEGDGLNKLTIVLTEENSNIALLWPSVAEICRKSFEAKLEQIGKEMKAS